MLVVAKLGKFFKKIVINSLLKFILKQMMSFRIILYCIVLSLLQDVGHGKNVDNLEYEYAYWD